MTEVDGDDATIDLRDDDRLRHDLVTSVVVTKMALVSLRGQWNDLTADERDGLLAMAERRCLHLERLVRGLLDSPSRVQRPSSS